MRPAFWLLLLVLNGMGAGSLAHNGEWWEAALNMAAVVVCAYLFTTSMERHH